MMPASGKPTSTTKNDAGNFSRVSIFDTFCSDLRVLSKQRAALVTVNTPSTPGTGRDPKASPNHTLPADLLPVSDHYGQPEIFAKFGIFSIRQRATITPQATRLPELPAGCDL